MASQAILRRRNIFSDFSILPVRSIQSILSHGQSCQSFDSHSFSSAASHFSQTTDHRKENDETLVLIKRIWAILLGIGPALRAVASMSREDWTKKLVRWKNEFVSTLNEDVNNLETYIVHVQTPYGKSFTDVEELDKWYHSFLQENISNSRMVYNYKNVIRGFSVMLADEVEATKKHECVLLIRPQRKVSLCTTHSPTFIGLQQYFGIWKESNYGKDVIIGVLDTGTFPNHPSFSDKGMSNPLAKWLGKCEFNNKIIGEKSFTIGNKTPFDYDGHATHTAGLRRT